MATPDAEVAGAVLDEDGQALLSNSLSPPPAETIRPLELTPESEHSTALPSVGTACIAAPESPETAASAAAAASGGDYAAVEQKDGAASAAASAAAASGGDYAAVEQKDGAASAAASAAASGGDYAAVEQKDGAASAAASGAADQKAIDDAASAAASAAAALEPVDSERTIKQAKTLVDCRIIVDESSKMIKLFKQLEENNSTINSLRDLQETLKLFFAQGTKAQTASQAEVACRGDVEDKVLSRSEEISNLEETLQDTEYNISLLKERINSIVTKIDTLKTLLVTLNDKIDKDIQKEKILTQDIENWCTRHTTLVEQLKAKKQQQQEEPTVEESEIVKLEDEIKQLEDQITTSRHQLMTSNISLTEQEKTREMHGQNKTKYEAILISDRSKLHKLQASKTRTSDDLEYLKQSSPSHSKPTPAKGSHTRSPSFSHFKFSTSSYDPTEADSIITTNHTKIKEALDHTYCTTNFKVAINKFYQDRIPADKALDIPSVESIFTSPDFSLKKYKISSALIVRSNIIRDLIHESLSTITVTVTNTGLAIKAILQKKLEADDQQRSAKVESSLACVIHQTAASEFADTVTTLLQEETTRKDAEATALATQKTQAVTTLQKADGLRDEADRFIRAAENKKQTVEERGKSATEAARTATEGSKAFLQAATEFDKAAKLEKVASEADRLRYEADRLRDEADRLRDEADRLRGIKAEKSELSEDKARRDQHPLLYQIQTAVYVGSKSATPVPKQEEKDDSGSDSDSTSPPAGQGGGGGGGQGVVVQEAGGHGRAEHGAGVDGAGGQGGVVQGAGGHGRAEHGAGGHGAGGQGVVVQEAGGHGRAEHGAGVDGAGGQGVVVQEAGGHGRAEHGAGVDGAGGQGVVVQEAGGHGRAEHGAGVDGAGGQGVVVQEAGGHGRAEHGAGVDGAGGQGVVVGGVQGVVGGVVQGVVQGVVIDDSVMVEAEEEVITVPKATTMIEISAVATHDAVQTNTEPKVKVLPPMTATHTPKIENLSIKHEFSSFSKETNKINEGKPNSIEALLLSRFNPIIRNNVLDSAKPDAPMVTPYYNTLMLWREGRKSREDEREMKTGIDPFGYDNNGVQVCPPALLGDKVF